MTRIPVEITHPKSKIPLAVRLQVVTHLGFQGGAYVRAVDMFGKRTVVTRKPGELDQIAIQINSAEHATEVLLKKLSPLLPAATMVDDVDTEKARTVLGSSPAIVALRGKVEQLSRITRALQRITATIEI